MLAAKLLSGMAGGAEEKLYVDDVFSAHTYIGNGGTQTINNGIDLAGKGGLVRIKNRGFGAQHILQTDTSNYLSSNLTNGNTAYSYLSSFNSNGFSLANTSSFQEANYLNNTYVAWTFRNSDKFHSHALVTKTAGSNATVSFPGLGTLGAVLVKRTDAAGSWYWWHRSLSAGQLLIGETTAAAATLGHITVSGTTVTLVNGVIADGTYLVEGFAHDPSADGIIQCGSFTLDGSGLATVNLGWEPQYVELKRINSTGNWVTVDSARGWNVGGNAQTLNPNTSSAELAGQCGISPSATGFYVPSNGALSSAGDTYIYLAIRRPNKPPTTGTQVYNAIARTGTGAAATVTGVGFSPDLAVSGWRSGVWSASRNFWYDRLRGANRDLQSVSAAAEGTAATVLTAFGMDGVSVGTSDINQSSTNWINHFFRRAPGFFDVVCYTGTGSARTVNHNLGVAPELVIVKSRSNSYLWLVQHANYGAYFGKGLYLNQADIFSGDSPVFSQTDAPSGSTFSLTNNFYGNNTGSTYVAYLFASIPGISKVGSYTGNGTSQTIPCGFTTGARFVLIKRTDAAGDWYVWDSVRGIVAANDPHLSLNTTAAEVTTDDSVDQDTSGFIVNQNTATNINVSGGSYIFLSVA